MKLFYSYCQKDEEFRAGIEKHLEALREKNLVHDEWYDGKILPGSKFQNDIQTQIRSTDIILLLISSNSLASSSCKEERREALRLSKQKGTKVIPVILNPCAWKDFPEISELLALPDKGKPITKWNTHDEAFSDIYEGIKSVVKSMEFSVKTDFRDKLTEIEFISQEKDDIRLDDIFVFPNIAYPASKSYSRRQVKTFSELWDVANSILIQGDEKSGKTMLCKKLFFECLSKKIPVVMISGREIRSPRNHDALIQENFEEQFHGNYQTWKNKESKTIIIDDMDNKSRLQFLDFAKEHFDRIFIATSKDNYLSYFRDEERLANYQVLDIEHFGHHKQESLIKRWKSLSKAGQPKSAPDGEIDLIEDRVNSIIINNKIVPRYPFYILSILQVYEAFMPQDMQVTSYGHCYQALITAQLIKCGIQKEDIDSVFNFLTELAFDMFKNKEDYSETSFKNFIQKYEKSFVIKESTINRLKSGKVIMVDRDGKCKLSYSFVYYFFLGLFFARNYDKHKEEIGYLAEKSYLRDNRYILIFTIHHAYDTDIIDTILLHTMDSLNHIPIAKLTPDETKPLISALREIPREIISNRSTEEEREAEKDRMDKAEKAKPAEYKETDDEEINSVYKSLKNMEILGQILRNKYGSFSKDRLQEIITTIADAGLRIAALVTNDKSISELESCLVKKVKENDSPQDEALMEDRLRSLLRVFCFCLILAILSRIVDCVRKPELSDQASDACKKQDTPAYDLIDFFFVLGTATELRKEDVDRMDKLLKKFKKSKNEIAKTLLSIKTQDYLNKHDVKAQLNQRICSLLEIKYKHSPVLNNNKW